MCTKCAHDGKKVCGSDGKTYNDFCKLQKVACESNNTLTMARKGPCEGRFLLLHFVSLQVGPFGGRGREGSSKETAQRDHDGIREYGLPGMVRQYFSSPSACRAGYLLI